MKYNHLDLFSGIGGFALAARMAGVPIDRHFHSDIEPYANRVYAKNFPGAVPLGDVGAIDGARLRADHPGRWIVTGGFPCQDISVAGLQKGLDGARSGLWFHMCRIIDELRPDYVIGENVAALTFRGLDRVLGSLAAIGFDAQWQVISARAVGAPHLRERLWFVAYPSEDAVADPDMPGLRPTGQGRGRDAIFAVAPGGRDLGASPDVDPAPGGDPPWVDWQGTIARDELDGQPVVCRVDHGIPGRLDLCRGWQRRGIALGNAIVPQVAAMIFGRIMEAENFSTSLSGSRQLHEQGDMR